ncbi:biopolymer transporter ExbD [Teredinibacter sp. KSP-S5-2]|uniref:ExbD/TolR family protein n=1 Tax=Teredinibacter sp. KSP-S5-2 TaxID=3034506 RepID=UPI0029347E1D|nr:biopolymer transporter ExbD [Teredinibacter sp. KSP-S5-2]WNO10334.1 biopolymer transporter ExbD [Teredinibacter sp. KSP-S5-2]
MRMSLEQRLETNNKQDIDLAPLIDVVFILLIFFIVTTVFVKETGVDIEKPKAVSTQSLERNVVLIAITSDRQVVYDGANVGVSGVRSTVSSVMKRKQKPLVIKADKTVSTELLVQVIDQAKLGGAEQINIATSEQ